MKRAAKPRPPIDYGRDRARWTRLIHDTHIAVASDDPAQRAAVAAAGCAARNVWNPPAPYPDGLLALSFAQLVYAWGRQTDAGLRAATRDVLMQAAGLADQVVERGALSVGIDLSSQPDRIGSARPSCACRIGTTEMSARTERDAIVGNGRGRLHADDDMRARVADWRRQRMNWAAIARNLGRSEPDVRREFADGEGG